MLSLKYVELAQNLKIVTAKRYWDRTQKDYSLYPTEEYDGCSFQLSKNLPDGCRMVEI